MAQDDLMSITDAVEALTKTAEADGDDGAGKVQRLEDLQDWEEAVAELTKVAEEDQGMSL